MISFIASLLSAVCLGLLMQRGTLLNGYWVLGSGRFRYYPAFSFDPKAFSQLTSVSTQDPVPNTLSLRKQKQEYQRKDYPQRRQPPSAFSETHRTFFNK